MIDYIHITKYLNNEDKVNTDDLRAVAVYDSGWSKYILQGCKELEVWVNYNLHILKIKGSIAYYHQGHNFTFDNRSFVEAINRIEILLDCDLWGAVINEFEFGTIIQVEYKPKEYIQRHRESKGLTMNEIPKYKGLFRYYEDKYVSLKMYDAGRNIKHKQNLDMRKKIEVAGWNPDCNYLKWEIHYKRPQQLLDKGNEMILSDLVNPIWNDRFNADLLEQYKRLTPTKSMRLATDKKDCSSADIVIQELAEKEINNGGTLQEIKKRLYKRISLYPEYLFSLNDKKARKRQIKSCLDKLQFEENSKWDLYDKLSKKIEVDSS